METTVWVPQKKRGVLAGHYQESMYREARATMGTSLQSWGHCTSETCNCSSHSPRLARYEVAFPEGTQIVADSEEPHDRKVTLPGGDEWWLQEYGGDSQHRHRYHLLRRQRVPRQS